MTADDVNIDERSHPSLPTPCCRQYDMGTHREKTPLRMHLSDYAAVLVFRPILLFHSIFSVSSKGLVLLFGSILSRGGYLLFLLPVPYSLQELRHVHAFCLHLYHPRMLGDVPGCCSSAGVLFETVMSLAESTVSDVGGSTHQHSMKYLKFSLHLSLFSGSSFSFGMGCRTM